MIKKIRKNIANRSKSGASSKFSGGNKGINTRNSVNTKNNSGSTSTHNSVGKPTQTSKPSANSKSPKKDNSQFKIVKDQKTQNIYKKSTSDKTGKSLKSKSLVGLVKSTENELRLNKAIADSGLVSRRKADELIEQGAVKVNGKIVKELGKKVKASDKITVNGDPIPEFSRLDYILLNKPKNYICTTSDEKKRKTIFDIVKSNERVFPVGRLDRNTTGVILITNDGELTNRLTHPSYQIQKTYIVKLNKDIGLDIIKQITEGVELEDGKTSPAFVVIDAKDKKKVTITITEGKNREVRRIFEHFGFEIESLTRKMFAGLTVKGLSRGEYRRLDRREVEYLKKLVGLNRY